MEIYKDATKIPFLVLEISVDDREDDERFSRNQNQFYQINNVSDNEGTNH